jgi:site-specific DNA-methyltransferase (adenine-specific)
MRLLLGDCIDKLKELDDNSVDSIVTDPPYGLSFMGKKWDYDVPSQEIWEECYRVLKPGGHLLSFAGSRTYHRMAVRVEDAGFEIRDQIMWIYGSGFPKSMNIGKGIDKKFGAEREVIGTTKGKGGENLNKLSREGKGDSDDANGVGAYGIGAKQITIDIPITAPATDEAKEWEGWGTALKPAHEPIVMARKPLSEKTVVDNVLEWGTGGINIDESRIGYRNEADEKSSIPRSNTVNEKNSMFGINGETYEHNTQGRFPANTIFDEEAGKILDDQTGITKSGDFTQKGQSSNTEQPGGWKTSNREFKVYKGDSGGASRFFYCPKTSKTDRNEGVDGNVHPTVKPTDLMLYLIRLVTPKGGTTLDPFMGSGSTGKAAVRGGFDFVGIEREEEYMEIAEARIQYEIDNPYNEETGKRTEIKKETKETLNKFFG